MATKILNSCFFWSSIVVLMSTFPCTYSKNCPNGTIPSFEMTSGVSLPTSIAAESNWSSTVINTDDGNYWHHDCHSQCKTKNECAGFYLDHKRQMCTLLTKKLSSAAVTGYEGSYYEKTCLKTSSVECDSKQWSFERVTGMELANSNVRVMNNVGSRVECEEACLGDRSLPCRSAQYQSLAGVCVLNKHDRRSRPSEFRKTNHTVHYLENQCIKAPNKCVYNRITRPSIPNSFYSWSHNVSDIKECQKRCSQQQFFQCRSIAYQSVTKKCLFSPDDRYSLYSQSNPKENGVDYYEKADCLNVAMKCDATTMTVVITTQYPFLGKVYSLVNPIDCATSVNSEINDYQMALTLPLKSSICGTKNLGNGLHSNSIVVQHHPNVLQQSDRVIDVVCEYEEHRIRLKAGKLIEETEISNISSVVTGVAPTPEVKMRLVDANGHDLEGVDLGSDVYLRIELMDERIYGIIGSGLIAKSGDGSENITLIDEAGCPIESSVFPPLKPFENSKSLEAPFQAFRFASDSTVRFQITISFCLNECQPAFCDTDLELNATSYGRRRKRSTDPASGSLPDIVMEGSLKVRARLKLDNADREQLLSVDDNKNGKYAGHRVCANPSVVIVVSVLATLGQLVVIMACVYAICRGRHKIVSLTKAIASNERYAKYQGLHHTTSLSTGKLQFHQNTSYMDP